MKTKKPQSKRTMKAWAVYDIRNKYIVGIGKLWIFELELNANIAVRNYRLEGKVIPITISLPNK